MIFAFVLFIANISLNVLADGHEKCKNSKWGAGDELGGANYLSEKRTKLAAKLIKKGEDVPYPSLETLRKEDREEKPYLLFTIYNEEGDEIRKMIQNKHVIWS